MTHFRTSPVSFPLATSRTRHSFQSEPAEARPYASLFPSCETDQPASATVPSLLRPFGSRRTRGGAVEPVEDVEDVLVLEAVVLRVKK